MYKTGTMELTMKMLYGLAALLLACCALTAEAKVVDLGERLGARGLLKFSLCPSQKKEV